MSKAAELTREELVERWAVLLCQMRGGNPRILKADFEANKNAYHEWNFRRVEAQALLSDLATLGLAIVPIEPTKEMREAMEAKYCDDWRLRHDSNLDTYKAALSASPFAGN